MCNIKTTIKYNLQHQLGTRAILGTLRILFSLILKTSDEGVTTITDCQGRKPGLQQQLPGLRVTRLEKFESWILIQT